MLPSLRRLRFRLGRGQLAVHGGCGGDLDDAERPLAVVADDEVAAAEADAVHEDDDRVVDRGVELDDLARGEADGPAERHPRPAELGPEPNLDLAQRLLGDRALDAAGLAVDVDRHGPGGLDPLEQLGGHDEHERGGLAADGERDGRDGGAGLPGLGRVGLGDEAGLRRGRLGVAAELRRDGGRGGGAQPAEHLADRADVGGLSLGGGRRGEACGPALGQDERGARGVGDGRGLHRQLEAVEGRAGLLGRARRALLDVVDAELRERAEHRGGRGLAEPDERVGRRHGLASSRSSTSTARRAPRLPGRARCTGTTSA